MNKPYYLINHDNCSKNLEQLKEFFSYYFSNHNEKNSDWKRWTKVQTCIKEFDEKYQLALKYISDIENSSSCKLVYRLSPILSSEEIPDDLFASKFGGIPNFLSHLEDHGSLQYSKELISKLWPKTICTDIYNKNFGNIEPLKFLCQAEISDWMIALHLLTGIHGKDKDYKMYNPLDAPHYRSDLGGRDLFHYKEDNCFLIFIQDNNEWHRHPSSAIQLSHFKKSSKELTQQYLEDFNNLVASDASFSLNQNYQNCRKISGFELKFDLYDQDSKGEHQLSRPAFYHKKELSTEDLKIKEAFDHSEFSFFGLPHSQQTLFPVSDRYGDLSHPFLHWNDKEQDVTHQLYADLKNYDKNNINISSYLDDSST